MEVHDKDHNERNRLLPDIYEQIPSTAILMTSCRKYEVHHLFSPRITLFPWESDDNDVSYSCFTVTVHSLDIVLRHAVRP